MSETKRYDLQQGGIGCMGCGSMVEDSLGDYVRFEDLSSPDIADALGEALAVFIDDEGCRFDHHGYCQNHGVTKPCMMVEARAALARWAMERKGK